MKAYKQLTNILNKFSEDKTELTKVELNILSDIQKSLSDIFDAKMSLENYKSLQKKELQEIQTAIASANKVNNKAKAEAKKAQKTMSKANQILDKAEVAAKELGVKPTSIKDYNVLNKEEMNVVDLSREVKDFDWSYKDIK